MNIGTQLTISRIALVSMACVLISCTGTKSLLTGGLTYEEAGMYVEALENYSAAYRKKPSNAEAHVAAQRIAQRIYNSGVAELNRLKAHGDLSGMNQEWRELTSLYDAYGYVGFPNPSGLEYLFADARNEEADRLYEKAEKLMLEGNYEGANDIISELYRLDRNHEKAEYLEILGQIYPRYEKGKKAMNLELYRDAFMFFDEVVKIDAEFKDAMALRNECKELATFSVAYVPIHKHKMSAELELAIGTAIKKELLQLDDPFMRLLDRDNISSLLEEQQKSMTALFNQEKAVEAGKLEGATYVLTGELLAYDHSLSPRRRFEKKGYLGRTILHTKVRFEEFEQSRSISCSFRFQLLDSETGQVFLSEVVPFTQVDKVTYASFDGDKASLHEGDWKYRLIGSRIDRVYGSKEEKLLLDEKLNGRQKPKSQLELEIEFVNQVGKLLSDQIEGFEPP